MISDTRYRLKKKSQFIIKEYMQVFNTDNRFVHGLSIIDLIFNMGRRHLIICEWHVIIPLIHLSNSDRPIPSSCLKQIGKGETSNERWYLGGEFRLKKEAISTKIASLERNH